ncbi:WD40-repeat-containing domain protein [Fennellomyces sp. T-0311]|nr:WD40-repeat-containing domain protein [Fennellomyces sp. T-0311]
MMLAGGSFMTPSGQDLSAVQNAASEKKKKTPASTRAKPISCLAFSPDGNYLAAGEMGHQPRILIWDVKARVLLHECRGHKFGVLSLAFSPNMRYLVSIGFQHDGYLYVWHWRKGIKLAGNKVTSKVNALSFSKDGTYFVTAGLRHVKFWYFDARGRVPKRGNLSSRETQVLDGRSGILGALRESNFVAVGCDRGKTEHVYFLTDSGILCMFKEGRVIDKWVDLQVQSAYSIAISSNYVICACAGGIIRLFEPETLKYCGMLPKPHPLGTDIGAITSPDMIKHADENTYYPDVIAVTYDENAGKVTAVYADRSLFLWDIRDLKKIGKYRSFVFHSDCVWGVEPCPTSVDSNSLIPPNSFATHSADGTVRFWNLDNSIHPNSTSSSFVVSPRSTHSNVSSPASPIKSPLGIPVSPSSSSSITSYRRNIYSRELVKMLYVDGDAAEFSKLRRDVEFTDDQYPDFGIRSLKMSSDGRLLATGDRNGNLRVHSMESWEQITYQEAHDSEILAMDLTNPIQNDIPYMIVTASRDRLLHVFDINSGFQLVQTLDDHSSSITAVKFSKNAKRLISCGADKGVIFRNIESNESYYTTYHNYSGRGTVFDMSLDLNDRYVATVTGERRLFVFSIDSGKPVRVCKPETMEENVSGTSAENSGGSLINIDLDPFSGTYAVTSGSDRSLRLFDLTNSACIEKVCAHAELITAVKFVRTGHDNVRVVSTCSDGTIFVWKITEDIVCKMKARAFDKDPRAQQMVMNLRTAEDIGEEHKRTALQLRASGQPAPGQAVGANGRTRFRRVSTATAVRPTPSISQMVRQGERRTFSTMSPAESKYDDLYKKIAMSRRTKAQSDHLSSPENNSPTSPVSKATDKRTTAERKRDSTGSSGRRTPEGKLERLYNGIPTSGARERAISHVSNISSLNRYSTSNGESSPRSTGFNPLRQRDTNHLRMNTVIRRQMSRDALNKHQSQQLQASSTNAGSKERPRPRTNDGVIRRKRSANLNERRTSMDAPSLDKPIAVKGAGGLATITRATSPPDDDDRHDSDLDISITGRPGHQDDDDDDGEEAGDERDANDDDDDDDDDDEEEEEEEVIFITSPPEQDNIGKPFEVTSHDDIHDDPEAISANEKSAHPSDDEKNHTPEKHQSGEDTTADDDEDGSSEDNADDAIIQAITSREPPRMTPSLSRTTSMSVASRKGMHIDAFITAEDLVKDQHDPNHHDYEKEDNRQPFSPVSSKESSGGISPSGRDTPALRELQKKLEKAKKRQSFSARYLSSLGDRRGGGHHPSPSFHREPLEGILKSFTENADNGHSVPEQPTIPVVPPRIDTSSTALNTSNEPAPPDTPPEQSVPESSIETAPKQSVSPPKTPEQSTEIQSAAQEILSSATGDLGHESSVSMEKVYSTDTCASFDASHILSDLDGAIILLDSVIDAYTSAKASDCNRDFVAAVEAKLGGVVNKITQSTRSSPALTHSSSSENNHESSSDDSHEQQQDPATFALLDKYSTLLMQMVEKKLLSSNLAH